MNTISMKDFILDELQDLGAWLYHVSKYKSVYIKFANPSLGNLRIADHRGRKQYRYKWNLEQKGHTRTRQDGIVHRNYYSFKDVKKFLSEIRQAANRRNTVAFEMNDNSGSLFGNDRKSSPNQPDIKGQSKIVCPHCGESHEYWVSGWDKQGARGPWISLAFTAKDVEQSYGGSQQGGQRSLLGGNGGQPQQRTDLSKPQQQQQYNEPPMDFDDDIPF